MDGVEVRHLRALVAVVDEGGFTAAAAALGTSQAAVSRTVAGLERAIGARVLHRTTRSVSLSPVGARLLGHARRVLEETAAIARAVQQSETEVRIGYAWSALGRHTTRVQRQWADEHAGSELVFVQSNTLTAGLREGGVDLAVLRRPVDDDRFASTPVGLEPRFVAVATGHALARRRRITLDDFTGRTIAVDRRTGTTTDQLWPAGTAPTSTREVDGMDDWLTVIAAGRAVGISSEATARQHPRPGVTYRPLHDAAPVEVRLAWWRDSPPGRLQDVVRLVCAAYGRPTAADASVPAT